MGDNIKVVIFDKKLREDLEEMGFDINSDVTLDEFEKECNEMKKTPEGLKILSEFSNFINKPGLDRIKYLKTQMDKLKEMGKQPIGKIGHNGTFICQGCMTEDEWENLLEDEVITIKELRTASYYQCIKCKGKFKLNEKPGKGG